MIHLAVINLKTLFKRLMKIIIVILMVAMMIKFVKMAYYFVRNFDLENIKLNSHIEMIKNNVAIAKSFETKKTNTDSELKKILVAQLAVFSGAEEEIMEQENQEEVLEFQKTDDTVVPETLPEQKPEEQPPLQEQTNSQEQPQQSAFVQTAVVENNNKKDF